MMGWQRHLQSILCHFGRRGAQIESASINLSGARKISSYLLGEIPYQQGTLPYTNIPRPLHHYLQQLVAHQSNGSRQHSCGPFAMQVIWHLGNGPKGISSSRKLLADSSSDIAPVSSPLIPISAPNSGNTETQAVVSKPSKVQAVLKGIKQSPKKVNLVAALVRGMRVEDALLQLQVTVKRASQTVYQVIHSARANATHNHGLDSDRLLIAEAFVGKGFFQKRVSYHSKGRSGIKVRPECRLTVVVREMTPEEEAEIARLRVRKFRKLSKRESRLVPHKLIETTPIWNRKSKASNPHVMA